MKTVVLLDPHTTSARCIQEALADMPVTIHIARSAEQAIEMADVNVPDIVISELQLPSHSGTEFLYEFRSYTDWRSVPIITYSTIKIPVAVQRSRDWRLLNIYRSIYKPVDGLTALRDTVMEIMQSETANR
jgi:response regulator RpfG family c-di-GMP phosphodiesterase